MSQPHSASSGKRSGLFPRRPDPGPRYSRTTSSSQQPYSHAAALHPHRAVLRKTELSFGAPI
eukprot:9246556-Pyramimonas_sp.AAC.1